MPVGFFHGPRDEVDAGDARSRPSESGQGLLILPILPNPAPFRWPLADSWKSQGHQPRPVRQLPGGPLGMGGKTTSAGQTIRGHLGHGACQSLNALAGAGADGHDRSAS